MGPSVPPAMMRALLLLLALSSTSLAHARSWCANPIWVHEWGVQVFDAAGRPTNPIALPSWFHRGATPPIGIAPVRNLPPDTGVRTLPVLHFYAPRAGNGPIPLGLEVGFRSGDAAVWFPQVDHLNPARDANSPRAARAREQLVAARAALDTMRGARTPTAIVEDPTRQLIWHDLALRTRPVQRPHASRTDWVDALRGFDDALWVNRGTESERFVFYEAPTREGVALELARGSTWAAGRRHVVVRNRGTHAVHDVIVTHREGSAVFVFHAPSIPAGRSAGFVVEDHRVSDVARATRGHLRAALVDSGQPRMPRDWQWSLDSCVMMRDPAVPVESASGHRLYAHEVDAILDVWSAQLFDQPGTTIVYREDTTYLDQQMPVSIYTDMFHYVELRRTGLALWRGVSLP